ncbi:MAG TPA: LPS export ABC transporter permease LptF [Terriglobales bacterium]|nr:LPS export ABC transporter permease LptF [Terriglobales bacterium]
MRIFTRYILREVASHALIGVAVFTFVLFTRDLARILELVVRNSAPLPSVAEIFFFTVPVALTYTLPMGVLVGILIGLSRLSADSEITAMRAVGIGAWSFVRIISIFAISAWLFAVLNSVYLAPKSQAALGRLQDRLKTSQASFEIQPRVFYEGFPRLVLYVQDVKTASRAAVWKGVFIADMTVPSSPRITVAQQGVLVAEGPNTLHLHLTNGSMHEIPKSDDNYQVSTFQQTDIPISVPQSERQEEDAAPLSQLSLGELLHQSKRTEAPLARLALMEFHRRLALPTACLVLALVGIPLGLSSKKGGKSAGFVLTILLVFAYYSVSLIGVGLARQGKIPAGLGSWLADIAFFVGGAFLLWRAEHRPFELSLSRSSWNPFRRFKEGASLIPLPTRTEDAFQRASKRRRVFSARFPMILDDLVLRDFLVYLALIVSAFVVLLLVFTVFELIGDILRNHISPMVVGAYLLNVSPFFIYNIAPLGILLAVLITFGLMQRSNEITAMKATGISLYRIIVPVLITSMFLALGLFFFDQTYLPHTNKRQDALRNRIKGKPPQTYLNPDRKWIFGQQSTIYYYQFFDSDRDSFGNLSVFQFQPGSFQLIHRIYAERANWDEHLKRWVCTQGWERNLQGSAIESYHTFDVSTFAAMTETPGYFKKEVKQSSEMSYEELKRYIGDLQSSGFDVVRLRVQLQKKFAYPAIALVMAILAVPFSVSSGRRGAVAGIATAVGIAVVYLSVSSLFEAMGNVSQLPPMLAAWSPDIIFGLLGGYLIFKVPT